MGNLKESEVKKGTQKHGNESWEQRWKQSAVQKENHQYSKVGRTPAPRKQNKIGRTFWDEDGVLYLDKGLGYTGMCIQQKMISYTYNVPV